MQSIESQGSLPELQLLRTISPMYLQQISDRKLAQHAYLLGCETTKQAIIIDPERDIDRYFDIAKSFGLTLIAAAETHIHADYLSGLRQCAEAGMKIYASEAGDADWQYFWLKGSAYQYELLKHGSSIDVGTIRLEAIHSPGHTPEHLSFLIYETKRDSQTALGIISGDFLFVGDLGRPDLLETAAGFEGTMRESAKLLFKSVASLRALSPALMVLPNHSAGSSCGKAMSQTTLSTLGYEISSNPALQAATDESAFVDFILSGQPEPPPYFARMKEENRRGPAVLSALPSPQSLKAADLEKILSPEVVVIDTRSWAEFRSKRIKGALFAPLEKDFTTTIGSYIQPNESICLVVETDRQEEAVRDCIRVGLDRVVYVLTPALLASLPLSDRVISGSNELPMSTLKEGRIEFESCLLDLRKRAELIETGGIANSYNIPHVQLLARHRELPREKNIHLWCRTGNRSRYAYSFLERQGYDVTLLDGGIVAWQEMNGELVR